MACYPLTGRAWALSRLNRCIAAGSGDAVLGELVALVRSLEPPPPQTVSVADITVQKAAPVDEMVRRLESFGAVVIERAADNHLMNRVEAELEAAGAWSMDPDSPSAEDGTGRMGMDGLVKAPSIEGLLAHPLALAAARGLLGKSCKRVTLKEIEIFAVQPGKGRQNFHREDQFWAWHHEPYAWAVSVLWAVDDNFSEASGGTREASSPTQGSLLRGGSANLLLACRSDTVLAHQPRP